MKKVFIVTILYFLGALIYFVFKVNNDSLICYGIIFRDYINFKKNIGFI